MPLTKDVLIEALKGVPGSARVYVQADHGQCSETAHYINLSNYSGSLPYSDDDNEVFEEEECNLEDVTAILIS
jgi:hypothetical protein